jgi:[acyl-carrier-protein] S-malonyltransferase
MQGKPYILCPGQGAQAVGMGKSFFEGSAVARSVFESANSFLGFDLASICFSGPDERLNQTDISQPAIYVTGVASFRAAVEEGAFEAGGVAAYAGLSLGEYTALHLAGAFSFEDGLRLVGMRGKLMQQAAVATPSGMVAIVGADEPAVAGICERASQGQVLVAANFNAPGQIVVSGALEACDRAATMAETEGFKSTRLVVAGAFHSPLMQSAADRMKEELQKANIKQPAVPVYSNVTAEIHGQADSIRRLLVDQIVSPVRWAQTMAKIMGAGEGRFIELAPGRTLAGLARRINRKLGVESLESRRAEAKASANA